LTLSDKKIIIKKKKYRKVRQGILKEKFCLILLFILLVIGSLSASETNWIINFEFYTADTLISTDRYNRAAVHPDASLGHDIFDAEELFPPFIYYVMLYFPHDNPEDLNTYWEPPYNYKYTFDYHPPILEGEDSWYMEAYVGLSFPTDVILSWRNIGSVPFDMGLFLVDTTISDTVNLRAEQFFTFHTASMLTGYDFIARRNVNTDFRLVPVSTELTTGVVARFYPYIYDVHGDSLLVPVTWRTNPDGIGYFLDNSRFIPTEEGDAYIIADYYHLREDSVLVHISGEYDSISLPLRPGWNTISLPVTPAIASADTALGDAFSSLLFSFEPTGYAYERAETVGVGTGYFVYSDEDTSITVSGVPAREVSIPLSPGWNLIGVPFGEIDEITTSPPDAIWEEFFWFNPDLRRYETESSLLPGRGYWVAAFEECDLLIR